MTRLHVFIRDLKPGALVDSVYSLVNPQTGVTRNGKCYFKVLLRDSSGEASARKWTFEESMLGEVSATGYARVVGRVEMYGGQLQVIVDQIEAVQISREDLIALLPATTKDIPMMFDEVAALLRSMDDPSMRALADAYLGDETMMAAFRQAPAATNVHHAWIGGLLEHTHQLMQLAERMLPLYPALNRDLVLMGLFLHDLGKTAELEWERGFNYTTDGNLVGHLVRGAVWLQVKSLVAARSGPKLPADALVALQHIIVSHHGQLEHGAAKLPATPEAIFVAALDNLEAKSTSAIVAVARERLRPGNAPFTERVWSLDTRLYRPDPLKHASAGAPAAEAVGHAAHEEPHA
ncbi:MAG: HD domain-containing protein [Planctomycetes bacterium]|nr:HD domain-containing protein [Planctomycetota bacterium]